MGLIGCPNQPILSIIRQDVTAPTGLVLAQEVQTQSPFGDPTDIKSREEIYLWIGYDGPSLEVLQYQANPRVWRSKLLSHAQGPKISLISKSSNGGRIRY